MKKRILLIIILVGICLLLAACQQNVRYHDASGQVTCISNERG